VVGRLSALEPVGKDGKKKEGGISVQKKKAEWGSVQTIHFQSSPVGRGEGENGFGKPKGKGGVKENGRSFPRREGGQASSWACKTVRATPPGGLRSEDESRGRCAQEYEKKRKN